jgi:hypothetical protein
VTIQPTRNDRGDHRAAACLFCDQPVTTDSEGCAAFALVGTIVTAVIIAIYMVVNLSCLVFYAREPGARFNWFLHGLVPLLGIAAFVPAFLTAVGIKAFSFVSALPYPISLVGPVVGIWYALGVVFLIVLAAWRPQRLRDTGRVFVEEHVAEAATPA